MIRPGVELRRSDVELRTSRSSGPGGQHANVTASRVEAVLDVAASSLPEDCKRRVLARLGPRVTATAQDTRSQARNRELALERLRDRLEAALHVRRARRPSRPSAAARRRRAGAEAAHLRAQAGAPAPGRRRRLTMSSRSAGFWVAVFLVLAFAGGGGLDLLSDDSGTNRADLTGRVTRVVDGDTVKVRLGGERGTQTVRYIGVDTPETVKPGEPVQCFGKQASAFNERLVEGRRVRLRGRA